MHAPAQNRQVFRVNMDARYQRENILLWLELIKTGAIESSQEDIAFSDAALKYLAENRSKPGAMDRVLESVKHYKELLVAKASNPALKAVALLK